MSDDKKTPANETTQTSEEQPKEASDNVRSIAYYANRKDKASFEILIQDIVQGIKDGEFSGEEEAVLLILNLKEGTLEFRATKDVNSPIGVYLAEWFKLQCFGGR